MRLSLLLSCGWGKGLKTRLWEITAWPMAACFCVMIFRGGGGGSLRGACATEGPASRCWKTPKQLLCGLISWFRAAASNSLLKELLVIWAAPRGFCPLILFLAVPMKCRRRGDEDHAEEGSDRNVTVADPAAEEKRGWWASSRPVPDAGTKCDSLTDAFLATCRARIGSVGAAGEETVLLLIHWFIFRGAAEQWKRVQPPSSSSSSVLPSAEGNVIVSHEASPGSSSASSSPECWRKTPRTSLRTFNDPHAPVWLPSPPTVDRQPLTH